nr:MAG TPA: hypothetical protein [Caudoviricetes sp.]
MKGFSFSIKHKKSLAIILVRSCNVSLADD